MKLGKYIVIFLIINFGALAIGSWFMGDGSQSSWYQNLNKAPWTPPGWFFGVAWTFIMVCFSIYMAYLYKAIPNSKLKILFLIQFVLNVAWNYIFFDQKFIIIALLCIFLLTMVVGKFLYDYKNELKTKNLLILPYFVWLCIATSLNAYILIYN